MDCKGMFADIANLVGPDAATALAKKTTAHRKGMYCDGIFKCREEHVAAEVQPKEVKTRALFSIVICLHDFLLRRAPLVALCEIYDAVLQTWRAPGVIPKARFCHFQW